MAHDATKPVPAAPVVAVAPLDFAKDIKLPEGTAVDEAAAKAFIDIMNDTALTPQARAQALIDLQAKALTELAESRQAQWDELQTDWKTKIQSDPVLGGANQAKVFQGIGTLLDTYGDRETRAAYDLTGAGNHPAIALFLHKIFVKLGEPAPPPPPADAGIGDKAIAQKLFDKSNMK